MNGQLCDDGDLCTKDDQCRDGTCVGTSFTCESCEECSGDGCKVKDGFCEIDNVCYNDQAPNPSNAQCLVRRIFTRCMSPKLPIYLCHSDMRLFDVQVRLDFAKCEVRRQRLLHVQRLLPDGWPLPRRSPLLQSSVRIVRRDECVSSRRVHDRRRVRLSRRLGVLRRRRRKSGQSVPILFHGKEPNGVDRLRRRKGVQ